MVVTEMTHLVILLLGPDSMDVTEMTHLVILLCKFAEHIAVHAFLFLPMLFNMVGADSRLILSCLVIGIKL